MKAIVQDRYGTADVLEFRDIDEPVVGEDDVLVRVHAAGCRPGRVALHDRDCRTSRGPMIGLRGPKCASAAGTSPARSRRSAPT